VLNGQGVAGTQIAASAAGLQSGPGGSVTVAANSLTIEGGAQIASSTAGPGKGGDVNVRIANDVALSGAASDGTPSGITASAGPGSSGPAGEVVLTAGARSRCRVAPKRRRAPLGRAMAARSRSPRRDL
jgi:hypothetical protein